MVHRVLDQPEARDALLTWLRARRKLEAPTAEPPRGDPYDRLAEHVTRALDFDKISAIALGG